MAYAPPASSTTASYLMAQQQQPQTYGAPQTAYGAAAGVGYVQYQPQQPLQQVGGFVQQQPQYQQQYQQQQQQQQPQQQQQFADAPQHYQQQQPQMYQQPPPQQQQQQQQQYVASAPPPHHFQPHLSAGHLLSGPGLGLGMHDQSIATAPAHTYAPAPAHAPAHAQRPATPPQQQRFTHPPEFVIPRTPSPHPGQPPLMRRLIILWDIENVRPLRDDHTVSNSAFATMMRMFFMNAFGVNGSAFQMFACCHMLKSGVPSISEHTIDAFTPHGIIVTVMPKKKEGQADLALKYHLNTFHEMFPPSPNEDRVVVILSSDSDFEQDARDAKLRGCQVVVIYLPSQMSPKFLDDCQQLGIITWEWLKVLAAILHVQKVSEKDLFSYGPAIHSSGPSSSKLKSGGGVGGAGAGAGAGSAGSGSSGSASASAGPGPRTAASGYAAAVSASTTTTTAAAAAAAAAASANAQQQGAANKKPPVKFTFDAKENLTGILVDLDQRDVTREVLQSKCKKAANLPAPGMEPVQQMPYKNWQAWFYPYPASADEEATIYFLNKVAGGKDVWYKFVDRNPNRTKPTKVNTAPAIAQPAAMPVASIGAGVGVPVAYPSSAPYPSTGGLSSYTPASSSYTPASSSYNPYPPTTAYAAASYAPPVPAPAPASYASAATSYATAPPPAHLMFLAQQAQTQQTGAYVPSAAAYNPPPSTATTYNNINTGAYGVGGGGAAGAGVYPNYGGGHQQF